MLTGAVNQNSDEYDLVKVVGGSVVAGVSMTLLCMSCQQLVMMLCQETLYACTHMVL